MQLVLEVIRNVNKLNACKYYATKCLTVLLVLAIRAIAGYIQ